MVKATHSEEDVTEYSEAPEVDLEGLNEAERNVHSPKAPFFKFVLTGGPCGGKTTAMARLYSYLRERGFEVLTCPEYFTILSSNGFSLDFFGTDGMDLVVQRNVLNVQLSMEHGMEQILKAKGCPSILLCDRGAMDGAAYMGEDKWNALLETMDLDVTKVRDNNYNAVFHMVTAADGAEDFYTLENNQSRTETKEQARSLDKQTQKAWVGHPHMFVIDNSTDFEGKLQRLVNRMANIVGLPTNLSKRSAKFVLRQRPQHFPDDVKYHRFQVEKVYVVNQDGTGDDYSFIRKRVSLDKDGNKNKGAAYQLTTVRFTPDGKMIERKRIMTAREYRTAYKTRDVNRHIIHQERISFLYKLQSFTIHIYQEPVSDVCILHAQAETHCEGEPEVELPPFLDVEKRLYGTKEEEQLYGAYRISLIKN